MATHKEMHGQPDFGKIKIDKHTAIRVLTVLDVIGLTGLAVHFMAQNAVRDTSDVMPVSPTLVEECDAYQINLGSSDSFVDLNGKEVDIDTSHGIHVNPNDQEIVYVNQHPIVGNCVTEVKNG